MTNSKAKVVAIDGPCGSGKSTIAKLLALKIGALYIDTGAMFRAIALGLKSQNIEFKESLELTNYINNMSFKYGVSESELVVVDGINQTSNIRNHEVSGYASQVSQLPVIRKFLVNFQRSLVQKQVCVMEGRDIGTVVFPDSFCKFYLTASVEERANRRLGQLSQNGETNLTLEQVIKDVEKRDHVDMTRENAPLKQAEDAILVDSTTTTTEEVLVKMSNIVEKSALENSINI